MATVLSAPEKIHPSLWRGAQLARARGTVVDTGYPSLSEQLPGGGWPVSALIELLTQQPGVGEMRMLAPALAAGKAPVAMIQPPADPVIAGLSYVGIPADRLLLLRAKTMSDQLWAAEQVLRAGTCSAVLLWHQHVHADWLRRLHLSARTGNALLFMVRPLTCAQDASPAELRIAVRPDESGAAIRIIKRKGPTFEGELSIELWPSAALGSQRSKARRPARPATPQREAAVGRAAVIANAVAVDAVHLRSD
ncbi:translesion DNA synthesis-associated protein ImuA [Paraburkholderia sp.]|jgi:hypothetical protein|uniref:translesion DNA synthesis-associated protein ImuA n=1 Tax=Paraburkholderia sp. TaxID=1926495 RepID=UPI002F423011